MSKTCEPTGDGPHCRTTAAYWVGREAEDLPPGWMDDMIRRLFDEWNRQMIKLEDLKSGSNKSEDAQSRAHDARTLAQLERSLDALIKLETQRATSRSKKVSTNHAEARAAFERRVADFARAAGATEIPEESDE